MPMVTVQKCEKALFMFYSKVGMPVTQYIVNISQYSFRLTNFYFVIFIFKALYGSILVILDVNVAPYPS